MKNLPTLLLNPVLFSFPLEFPFDWHLANGFCLKYKLLIYGWIGSVIEIYIVCNESMAYNSYVCKYKFNNKLKTHEFEGDKLQFVIFANESSILRTNAYKIFHTVVVVLVVVVLSITLFNIRIYWTVFECCCCLNIASHFVRFNKWAQFIVQSRRFSGFQSNCSRIDKIRCMLNRFREPKIYQIFITDAFGFACIWAVQTCSIDLLHSHTYFNESASIFNQHVFHPQRKHIIIFLIYWRQESIRRFRPNMCISTETLGVFG